MLDFGFMDCKIYNFQETINLGCGLYTGAGNTPVITVYFFIMRGKASRVDFVCTEY